MYKNIIEIKKESRSYRKGTELKNDIKVIISYWSAHELEDES